MDRLGSMPVPAAAAGFGRSHEQSTAPAENARKAPEQLECKLKCVKFSSQLCRYQQALATLARYLARGTSQDLSSNSCLKGIDARVHVAMLPVHGELGVQVASELKLEGLQSHSLKAQFTKVS